MKYSRYRRDEDPGYQQGDRDSVHDVGQPEDVYGPGTHHRGDHAGDAGAHHEEYPGDGVKRRKSFAPVPVIDTLLHHGDDYDEEHAEGRPEEAREDIDQRQPLDYRHADHYAACDQERDAEHPRLLLVLHEQLQHHHSDYHADPEKRHQESEGGVRPGAQHLFDVADAHRIEAAASDAPHSRADHQ